MRDIFEADQRFLTDFAADPTVSLKVLDYLRIYREGSDQARKGMADKLRDLGAHALPAIIQSTFTLWNQIKDDHHSRSLIRNLIGEICRENLPAREFLFRMGLQKNPFLNSRCFLAEVALEVTGGNLTGDERTLLQNPDPGVVQTSPYVEEFLPLMEVSDRSWVLAQAGSACIRHLRNHDLVRALELAAHFQAATDVGLTELIHSLFTNIPMGMTGRRPAPLAQFLPILRQRPFMMGRANFSLYTNAFEWVLSESSHPQKRNKYVECSFVTSVHLSVQKDADLLVLLDRELETADFLVSYWWQSLLSPGMPHKKRLSAYFASRAIGDCPDRYLSAGCLQFFFAESRFGKAPDWLSGFAQRCREERMDLYDGARYEVVRIGSGTMDSSPVQRVSGPTELV